MGSLEGEAMTLRLALTPDQVAAQAPAKPVDVGVTVDEAARILGCDPSTVRKLLTKKKLGGHRVGLGEIRGGVRVSLQSIDAYKRSRAIGAASDDDQATPANGPKIRRRGPNPAHDEALAQLRAWGVQI